MCIVAYRFAYRVVRLRFQDQVHPRYFHTQFLAQFTVHMATTNLYMCCHLCILLGDTRAGMVICLLLPRDTIVLLYKYDMCSDYFYLCLSQPVCSRFSSFSVCYNLYVNSLNQTLSLFALKKCRVAKRKPSIPFFPDVVLRMRCTPCSDYALGCIDVCGSNFPL